MPLKKRKTKKPKTAKSPTSFDRDIWTTLCRAIDSGLFVPIISNSVRDEAIFGDDDPAEDEADNPYTVHEELVMEWAGRLEYPLAEKHRLARVAQYNYVLRENIPQAKTDYLDFIKGYLLDIAEDDDEVAGSVPGLREQSLKLCLADIAHDELEYPYFEREEDDPLRLLARLPLPIYVTTSYYSFLEKIIKEEGRKVVHSHICPWSGNIPAKYLPDPNFKPTPEEPVVYHLFGLDDIPTSLVLSEDDHLDFLVKVAQDINTVVKVAPGVDTCPRLIPLYLRTALAESALMLLGYRLQGWDFRVLFRGIINAGEARLRPPSLAIQLEPDQQKGVEDKSQARAYLEKYFKPPFQIEWNNTPNAVNKLWEVWQKWPKS